MLLLFVGEMVGLYASLLLPPLCDSTTNTQDTYLFCGLSIKEGAKKKSRRSFGGVRRRGAEERHAAWRKRVALQRGGAHRAPARGSAGRHRAAPFSGAKTETCAQVARAGGVRVSSCCGRRDWFRKRVRGVRGVIGNTIREVLFLLRQEMTLV